MSYRTIIGARRKQYSFACRDDATGALKPIPPRGSRKKFCRHCPALRIHHKCIFGERAARERLVTLLHLPRTDAHALTGFCACGRPLNDDEEFLTCRACRERATAYRHGRKTCAFDGCKTIVQTKSNKSGMCQIHARQLRAQKAREKA